MTIWLADGQPIRVNVKAAGGTSPRVKCIIRLSVKIGGHKAKIVFEVAPKPAAKTNFEMAFIDKDNDRIEAKSRQVISKKGHAVVTIPNFEEEDGAQFADSNTTGPARITKSKRHCVGW